MKRELSLSAAAAVALALAAAHCNIGDPTVSCAEELHDVVITAHAGVVQVDGSVTIYGTVEFSSGADGSTSPEGGPAELTVRSVQVAGVPASQASDGFNFETWTVVLTGDRIAAYANGGKEAQIPVVARLYGGCIAQLPEAQEPTVRVVLQDGGMDAKASKDAPSDGFGSDADAGDAHDSSDAPPEAGGESGTD
jgi:hypothetical protein